MDKIINGSSVYDVLSAIIPGYLICLLGKMLLFPTNDPIINGLSDTCSVVMMFTVSYLVGLLFKTFTEKVFPFLRNKPDLLRKACKDAEIDKETKESILFEKDDWKLLRKYYTNYYIAVNNNANSSIGILEAQIAFIRSMILVIFLYILALPKIADYLDLSCRYIIEIFIFQSILEGDIYILIRHLQYRVHKLVWEDSFYALRAKKEEKP